MKISVVIPLYNKQETVLRAVNSVLAQTGPPQEIIVVNDGSTDGSEQIVLKLDHPLVSLINQSNAGVSAARNRGIKEAKCDWIAFLDADDEWLPDFIKTIESLYSKYPDALVFATAYFLKYPNGSKRKVILNRLRFTDTGILDNYFEVAAYSEPPIHSSSVVVNKQAMSGIGGFPEGIASGEDLLTWARLAINNIIAYSNEALSLFEQDPAHVYRKVPNRIPQEPDIVGKELALIERNFSHIPGLAKYVGHWHKMRASVFLRLGLKKKALSESNKSLAYNPWNLRILSYYLLLLLPTFTINRIFRVFRRK